MCAAGNLNAMTYGGGAYGSGPVSNVILGGKGNLYGTVAFGSDLKCGMGSGRRVVWAITP
jgi:hypothetical protein